MSSAISALRRALRDALVADAALLAKLGGPKVYDEAPRESEPPYVAFGETQARDWSTASDRGCEQLLTLDIWSLQRGRREALDIADCVTACLDAVTLVLTGHRLVNFRFIAQDMRRESAGRFSRVSLRYRAVTETL